MRHLGQNDTATDPQKTHCAVAPPYINTTTTYNVLSLTETQLTVLKFSSLHTLITYTLKHSSIFTMASYRQECSDAG